MAKEHLTAVVGANYGPFKSAMRDMKGSAKGMARDLMSAGKTAAAGLAVIAVPLTLAARTGMNFEREMSRVNAIMRPSKAEFSALTKEAMRLGATTEKTATDVAGGIKMLAQAGFKTKQIMKALPAVVNMSTLAELDMASATTMVTMSMGAFNLEAEESSRVADVLAKTSSSTNTSVSQLFEGLSNVGKSANKLGWDLEQTSGALGLIANQTYVAGKGGTFFNQAIMKLVKPTEKGAALMKKYGINIRDAAGEFKTLPDLVKDIEDSGLNLNDNLTDMNEMFGTRGVKAIQGFTDAVFKQNGVVYHGSEALRKLSESLKKSNGYAKTGADIVRGDTKGAWESFGSAVEGTAIALYYRFNESLKTVFESLTAGVRGMRTWILESKGLKKWLDSFFGDINTIVNEISLIGGALSGAFDAGLSETSKMNTGMISLLKSFREWVQEIAPELPKLVEEWGGKFDEAWKKIKGGLNILNDLTLEWEEFSDAMKPVGELVDVIGDGLGYIGEAVEYVVEGLSGLAGEATAFLSDQGGWESFMNVVRQGLYGFSEPLEKFWGYLKSWPTTLIQVKESLAAIFTGEGLTNVGAGAANIARSWITGFVNTIKQEGYNKVSQAFGSLGKLFLGHSPAEEGPLAFVNEGGKNIARSWIEAFREGIQEGREGMGEELSGFYRQLMGEDLETGMPLEERLEETTNKLAESTSAWAGLTQGFYNSMDSGIQKSVGGILSGTASIGGALQGMYKSTTSALISSLTKQAAQQVVHFLFGSKLDAARKKASVGTAASIGGANATALAAATMPAPVAKAIGIGMKTSILGMANSGGGGGGGSGGIMGSLGIRGLDAKEISPLTGAKGVGGDAPGLAEGGIVSQPTSFIAGDGAGAERVRVEPLDGPRAEAGNKIVEMRITVVGGAVDDRTAMGIAEALSRVVKNDDVQLLASEAKIAIEVEPSLA